MARGVTVPPPARLATMNETSPFDENDLVSLGKKLAALDLTEREQAALGEVLSDDDVQGFARFDIVGSLKLGMGVIEYQDGNDFKAGSELSQPYQDGTDLFVRKPGK